MPANANTTQAIRAQLALLPPGQPFCPSRFTGLGSRAAIDQALMRLKQAGHIDRIAHGLYAVPHTNRFGIKVLPSAEQIAHAIAQAEGARIDIHGAEAAHRLGLSTQVPAHAIFQTSGSPHQIRLGKLVIRLQHAAPRKLALAGRPAGQALSALWYLGRQHVTADTFRHLAHTLSSTEFDALRQAQHLMPSWMAQALAAYEKHLPTHA